MSPNEAIKLIFDMQSAPTEILWGEGGRSASVGVMYYRMIGNDRTTTFELGDMGHQSAGRTINEERPW